MNKMVVFLAGLLFVLPTAAADVIFLPEVMRPGMVRVAENRLYVTEESCIHLYSLRPFSHVKMFGIKGEGPGEFKFRPNILLSSGVCVNGLSRLMHFSRDGEFLREIKLPFRFFYFYYPLIPFSNGYTGFKMERFPEQKKFRFVAKLFDTDFKPVRDFYTGGPPHLLPPARPGSKPKKVDLEVIPDCLDFAVSGDKIFIADTRKGFYIAVFDRGGDPLYEIEKAHQKIAVPEKFKAAYLKKQRESENWEETRNRFHFVFRDFYPAYFSFHVDGDKLYLTTYAQKDDLFEMVVMDLRGNELSRAFVFPLSPFEKHLQGFVPYSAQYDIDADRLYYLKDNPREEMWELHMVDIK